MSIRSKFKNFFWLDDEELDENEQDRYIEEEEEIEKPLKQSKQNVVSLQSIQKNSKVIIMEPRVYADAQEIADHLKNRRACVVNLQRIKHEQAVRIVDFLSGTVYAIGGDIQKIGVGIFLCTPDNVDVSGTVSDTSFEEDPLGKGW